MASGDTLVVFRPQDNEPPATIYATIWSRNQHPVLAFDGNADEEAVFSAVLPRMYSGGGITVRLHIAFSSATSGTSRWQAAFERIEASALDIDADSFASFQSNGVAAPGTSGQVVTVDILFTNSDIDGLLVGEGFRLKTRRDADGSSGTDDIATDAELRLIELFET